VCVCVFIAGGATQEGRGIISAGAGQVSGPGGRQRKIK
jgi:hypothetical protein